MFGKGMQIHEKPSHEESLMFSSLCCLLHPMNLFRNNSPPGLRPSLVSTCDSFSVVVVLFTILQWLDRCNILHLHGIGSTCRDSISLL